MAHLLKDPGLMEMVKSELDRVVGGQRKVEESDIATLKFLEAVVKETFRLHPPVPLLVRTISSPLHVMLVNCVNFHTP